MCIVLDVNIIPNVFNKDVNFKPVFDWIFANSGFLVYGGTQYRSELAKMKNYLVIINTLNSKRKIKKINDEVVDSEQKEVDSLVNCNGCDDSHLIAIIRASGCRLICTNDKRADHFIKDKTLYINGIVGKKRPKIYRNKNHKKLLASKNIVNICNESK